MHRWDLLRGTGQSFEPACLVGEWNHPYSREIAAYPHGLEPERGKMWPAVRRIDGAYGDRNLVCSCPPLDAY